MPRVFAVSLLMLLVGPSVSSAQITTGTVAGTVKDAQGGVIPGATVTLISETRGTKSPPVVTNATGDFVFVERPAGHLHRSKSRCRLQDAEAHRACRSAPATASRSAR